MKYLISYLVLSMLTIYGMANYLNHETNCDFISTILYQHRQNLMYFYLDSEECHTTRDGQDACTQKIQKSLEGTLDEDRQTLRYYGCKVNF